MDHGVTVDTKLKHHGQIGLHWAACGGHLPVVKLLLEHGASVHVKDPNFDGNPLHWALYAWQGNKREAYYEVVSTLVKAGAKLEPELYEANEEGRRALDMFRSDRRMSTALGLKGSRRS